MCNPMAAAIGFTAASSLISGNAQYQAGQAESGLNKYNAAVETMAAQQVREAGEAEKLRHAQQVRRFLGFQRAAIASSDLRLDRGTPLQLQVETARQGRADAIEIENNIRREEWGHLTKAQGFYYEADQAKKAGKFGLIGTLLSGAGKSFGLATS